MFETGFSLAAIFPHVGTGSLHEDQAGLKPLQKRRLICIKHNPDGLFQCLCLQRLSLTKERMLSFLNVKSP